MPANRKLIWLILIVGFIFYLPALSNGFIWDDEELIVNNSQIQSVSNIPAFFSGSTFNSGGGVTNFSGLYFRPLMMSVFAITHAFFGQSAFGFHLVQIVCHLLNAVLTYLILFYIFKKFKLDEKLALVISLLFLVHPLNVEAASYLAASQEVLFYFFGALAFLLILKSKTNQQIFFSGLLLLPSLLSKETGIVFAVLIPLYVFCFEKQKLKYCLAGLGTAILVYFLMRFGLAQVYFGSHGLAPISNAPIWQRFLTIPKILAYYLSNFLWPFNIAIDQQWVVNNLNFEDFWEPLFFDFGFGMVLGYLGYLSYKQNLFKIWLFFLIWFLLAISLHLQIFPLDMTVADRWFYMSMVGLLGMIIVPLKFEWIAVAVVVLFLGARTLFRETDWNTGLSLYSKDIKISQNAFDLENNLGVELARAGHIEEAKVHFEKSVILLPKWWTNWNNLGVMVEKEGDLKLAEEDYKMSIKNGIYYRAYENYARVLYLEGKRTEAKNFLETTALPKLPYNLTLQQIKYLLDHNE